MAVRRRAVLEPLADVDDHHDVHRHGPRSRAARLRRPRPRSVPLPPALTGPNHSFKFNNEIFNEITDETTTAHCSVTMLKCPSDEAGPSH